MNSLKPYLIRSVYEWVIDNNLTPHLLVSAKKDSGAVLPEQFIDNGKIVLNIRPEAIQDLSLGNKEIKFDARFGGKPMQIIAPISAVLAIYAKENGKGMIFDHEESDEIEPPPGTTPSSKPRLRVVK